ncbi:Eukaryotic translation initiation factor eIF-1 [Coemansia erecta]|nr:Eukaryotic translation initiation factor eIF-1 [Coemansia erecta]
MSQSELKNEIADVDSPPAGSPPKLVADLSGDSDSDSSIFSDADVEETPKTGKKSSKKAGVEVFDNIDYSVSLDPFGSGSIDEFAKEKKSSGAAAKSIHIRLQQRNARKSTTTLQGLPEEFDLKKLLKYFKKTFGCLGTIVKDPEYGKVIQVSGDQRVKLSQFLVSEGIAKERDIQVHGF